MAGRYPQERLQSEMAFLKASRLNLNLVLLAHHLGIFIKACVIPSDILMGVISETCNIPAAKTVQIHYVINLILTVSWANLHI